MNKEAQNQELNPEDEIVYLSGTNSKVYAKSSEFICMETNGTVNERVTMSRAMPFSDPDSYIIVKNSDEKEIGIIRSLNDFDKATKELIEKHLSMRYYCPKILEICEVKDKFGFIYVTVDTDSGQKNFASSDLTKSIKRIKGDKYIIVDVEGNRFLIEDLTKVKNYKKIIAYIV